MRLCVLDKGFHGRRASVGSVFLDQERLAFFGLGLFAGARGLLVRLRRGTAFLSTHFSNLRHSLYKDEKLRFLVAF